MLTIRMQRTGRRGHAQFRVVVQDSRFSPTSGRVVAYLGSYNPHSKTTTLDKEKAKTYLDNGAQPSERAAKLLKNEGVKLPNWVATPGAKTRPIRNQDKLRRNRPEEPKVEEAPVVAEAEAPAETPAEETPAEPTPEAPAEKAEETSAEVVSEETVAEDEPAEPANKA